MNQRVGSIRLLLVTVLMGAGITVPAHAVVAPDPTYGAGSALQGVLMPDGRVTRIDSEDLLLHLRRYSVDGQPDLNYGAAGQADIALPLLTGNLRWGWRATGTVPQPDGSMLLSLGALPRVASQSTTANIAAPYGAYLLRVDPTGRPHPTYGSNGLMALDPTGTNLLVESSALLPDGNVLVLLSRYADYACIGSLLVSRLRPSGAVEAGYDVGTAFRGCLDLSSMKPLPGGQVVLPSPTSGYARVLDSSLQPITAVTTGALPLLLQAASISDMPAAGRSYAAVMNGTHLRLSAISATLAFVAGFGDQGSGTADLDLALPLGRLVVPPGYTASVTSIQIVASGQHVLVSATATYGDAYVPVGHIVLRFNLDGSFDREFGDAGFVVLEKSALFGPVTAMVERSDGLLWLSQQNRTLRLQTRALRSSGVLGVPLLQLPSAPAEGATVSIPVQRALGGNGAVSLRYRTVDGTLAAGTDYVAASGTLAWADGDEADKTLAIQVLAGRTNGSFSVTLEQPTNGAVLGVTSVTIQRYDPSVTTATAAANAATSTAAASGGGGGGAFSGLTLLILLTMSLQTLWRGAR